MIKWNLAIDSFHTQEDTIEEDDYGVGNGEEIWGISGNVSSTVGLIRVRVSREVDRTEITFLPRETNWFLPLFSPSTPADSDETPALIKGS